MINADAVCRTACAGVPVVAMMEAYLSIAYALRDLLVIFASFCHIEFAMFALIH